MVGGRGGGLVHGSRDLLCGGGVILKMEVVVHFGSGQEAWAVGWPDWLESRTG